MPVPAAAVQAIQAGCDGVLDLQRRRRAAGGDARGAGQGRRDGEIVASAAGRCVQAAAGAPRSAFSRAERPKMSARLRAAAIGHRPRRAPGHRGGDGGVPVSADASRSWLKPRRLRPGDRVALVAPASPFKRDEFDAGVAELAALGFEPVYDERVFARRALRRRRARHCAPRRCTTRGATRRSPRIIAVRGGYGSAQLLPLLDAALMRAAPQDLRRLQRHHGAARRFTCSTASCAFHGPMIERRLARGRARLRSAIVSAAR